MKKKIRKKNNFMKNLTVKNFQIHALEKKDFFLIKKN